MAKLRTWGLYWPFSHTQCHFSASQGRAVNPQTIVFESSLVLWENCTIYTHESFCIDKISRETTIQQNSALLTPKVSSANMSTHKSLQIHVGKRQNSSAASTTPSNLLDATSLISTHHQNTNGTNVVFHDLSVFDKRLGILDLQSTKSDCMSFQLETSKEVADDWRTNWHSLKQDGKNQYPRQYQISSNQLQQTLLTERSYTFKGHHWW